jgi:hypothetical protein
MTYASQLSCFHTPSVWARSMQQVQLCHGLGLEWAEAAPDLLHILCTSKMTTAALIVRCRLLSDKAGEVAEWPGIGALQATHDWGSQHFKCYRDVLSS